MGTNRVLMASKELEEWLSSFVSTAKIVRSYAPRQAVNCLENNQIVIFVTPEDVTCIDKNHNKKKFYDEIVFTLSIVCKVSHEDFTQEVDKLLEVVQEIRDALRFRHISGSCEVDIRYVENTQSRPLYDREKLELENLFISFLLVEVRIDAVRA